MEREECARNMLACDFALVARGSGNPSFRLYEAMSAEAIPIFIDTDCRLPFEDMIPYRQLFVWVPASDVGSIGDYFAVFHERHNDSSLFEHRCRVRQVFDDYLSPIAFHRRISGLLARYFQYARTSEVVPASSTALWTKEKSSNANQRS